MKVKNTDKIPEKSFLEKALLSEQYNATNIAEIAKSLTTIKCGKEADLVAVHCDALVGQGVGKFYQICGANFALPSEVAQATPSGGMYYIYRYGEFPKLQLPDGLNFVADGEIPHDPTREIYRLAGNLEDRPPLPEWLSNLSQDALDAALAKPEKAQADTDAAAEEEAKAEGEPLPDPPLHVFSRPIQVALQEIADAKNVPVEMPMATLLALAAACVGRARAVRYTPEWIEPACNLFLLIIAESGGGKSHTQKYMFQHLDRIEAIQKKRYKEERENYQNELIVWKKSKDENKKMPERPKNIQFLVDDATIESVAERLEDNPRGMTWFQDEMAGFFASLDRYNKGGGDGKKRLLQAFNSSKWIYSRRTKDGQSEERYLPSATLNIFGGIQPYLLPYLFVASDANQGLTQRFLYVRTVIDKPMKFPAPRISGATNDLLRKITERLVNLSMFGVPETGIAQEDILDLSPAARNVLENFMNIAGTKAINTSLYAYTVKMFNYALRLSGLLHLLDAAAQDLPATSEIESDTVERAVELVDWLLEHTTRVIPLIPKTGEKPFSTPVSARKSLDRTESLLKFIADHPEFCAEKHTLDEAFEKGLPADPWKGASDAGTAAIFAKWARTAGNLEATKSGKRWWIFSEFRPVRDERELLDSLDTFLKVSTENA